MKFPNSSLTFLLGLLAIASTAFVAAVDASSASSKSSKSGKSFKKSKSSTSSSDDVAVVTEIYTAVFSPGDAKLFAPPALFETLVEGGRGLNLSTRLPNHHEQRLLKLFTNNSKFTEKVYDHQKHRNLQAFAIDISGTTEIVKADVVEVSDDGVPSPADQTKFFSQVCTILDGVFESVGDDVSLTVNYFECAANLCTGEGDCVNLVISEDGTERENGFASIVSGRGKYFDITGQVLGETGIIEGDEPGTFLFKLTFTMKYFPSTLSEAQIAAVQF